MAARRCKSKWFGRS